MRVTQVVVTRDSALAASPTPGARGDRRGREMGGEGDARGDGMGDRAKLAAGVKEGAGTALVSAVDAVTRAPSVGWGV